MTTKEYLARDTLLSCSWFFRKGFFFLSIFLFWKMEKTKLLLLVLMLLLLLFLTVTRPTYSRVAIELTDEALAKGKKTSKKKESRRRLFDEKKSSALLSKHDGRDPTPPLTSTGTLFLRRLRVARSKKTPLRRKIAEGSYVKTNLPPFFSVVNLASAQKRRVFLTFRLFVVLINFATLNVPTGCRASKDRLTKSIGTHEEKTNGLRWRWMLMLRKESLWSSRSTPPTSDVTSVVATSLPDEFDVRNLNAKDVCHSNEWKFSS